MPGKYAPLTAYLAGQPGDQVELSLSEVEAIIGASLPRHAWQSTFWGNQPRWNGAARSWRSVGWRVVKRTYRPPGWVITFVRDGASRAREGLP